MQGADSDTYDFSVRSSGWSGIHRACVSGASTGRLRKPNWYGKPVSIKIYQPLADRDWPQPKLGCSLGVAHVSTLPWRLMIWSIPGYRTDWVMLTF